MNDFDDSLAAWVTRAATADPPRFRLEPDHLMPGYWFLFDDRRDGHDRYRGTVVLDDDEHAALTRLLGHSS